MKGAPLGKAIIREVWDRLDEAEKEFAPRNLRDALFEVYKIYLESELQEKGRKAWRNGSSQKWDEEEWDEYEKNVKRCREILLACARFAISQCMPDREKGLQTRTKNRQDSPHAVNHLDTFRELRRRVIKGKITPKKIRRVCEKILDDQRSRLREYPKEFTDEIRFIHEKKGNVLEHIENAIRIAFELDVKFRARPSMEKNCYHHLKTLCPENAEEILRHLDKKLGGLFRPGWYDRARKPKSELNRTSFIYIDRNGKRKNK